MGVYSPSQLGINANTTGGVFKNGAWYNGRQYWDGTLSDPGVIHPNSPQQGAGQEVSKEVVQQTNPNNWDYIQNEKARQAWGNIDQATGLPKVNKPVVAAQAPAATKPTATKPTGSVTMPQVPTIDLKTTFNSLWESSGIGDIERSISDIEKRMASKQQGYNTAASNYNDNPFLSEGDRVGRNQKLATDYQNAIAADQNELAMKKNDLATKKADIETKLNIELKQFDINSNAAQTAMQQFNTLLSMGALDGASGEDIANITRQTGLSSTMIQSAINAKNQKAIETSVINFDDGENQGFVVINKETGEIINKENIATSKPKEVKEASKDDKSSYYAQALREDAAKGMKLGQIFSLYTGYLDPDMIYQLYNANSKYGPDTGDYDKLVKMYGLKQQSY
jgi:hypothetical protein